MFAARITYSHLRSSSRTVRSNSAGVDGVVGPGREANQAWHGKLMRGDWEVHSGLNPGEVPGHPKKHPPNHLYLKMSVGCDARGVRP